MCSENFERRGNNLCSFPGSFVVFAYREHEISQRGKRYACRRIKPSPYSDSTQFNSSPRPNASPQSEKKKNMLTVWPNCTCWTPLGQIHYGVALWQREGSGESGGTALTPTASACTVNPATTPRSSVILTLNSSVT